MLKLLRQGVISKWFSGIGQEAIAVGVTMALNKDEYIMPLHRNLGVFTTRDIPLEDLMHQWQGNLSSFTKGRDRSFHFGTNEYHIAGMISHLGAMLSVANGVALADLNDHNQRITVAFSGDGGTSEGDFHEALNLAAVWNLPVLFVVENNGYGLSTPSSDQFKCNSLSDKGIGYGIESKTIDGNNILEVYTEVQRIASSMRQNPKPFLLECNTFRMRGHEEASGTKYVPQELLDHWETKDPIHNFKRYLIDNKDITKIDADEIEKKIKTEVDATVKRVFQKQITIPNTQTELEDVYKSFVPLVHEPGEATKPLRFIDAIQEGLDVAMQKYPTLILMGQDIAEYGGVFKITDGFFEKYGSQRVKNTPICESAPLGTALGLSIRGKKSMVEMQFSDFVSCGFNQIVNNIAKTHYRWGQNTDTVIRMPTGGGMAAGPFHSQSTEAWFFHTPGLKIVYPSNPIDAKGLLLAAFEDPNPVMFYEHKGLYRSLTEEVPLGDFTMPIGQAKICSQGEDITFITYGMAVHWCSDLINEMKLSATLVDLRTLLPWDKETVKAAVKATGKVVVVHEDTLTGGVGAEIAAWIGEHCFTFLDGPVTRVGSLDTPIPFNAELEKNFMAQGRLKAKVKEILAW